MIQHKQKRRPDQPRNIRIMREGSRLIVAQEQPTLLRYAVNFSLIITTLIAALGAILSFTAGALTITGAASLVGFLSLLTLFNWGVSQRLFTVDAQVFTYTYNTDRQRYPLHAIEGFDVRPMAFDYGLFALLRGEREALITDGIILEDARFIATMLEDQMNIPPPTRLLDDTVADDMFAWADRKKDEGTTETMCRHT